MFSDQTTQMQRLIWPLLSLCIKIRLPHSKTYFLVLIKQFYVSRSLAPDEFVVKYHSNISVETNKSTTVSVKKMKMKGKEKEKTKYIEEAPVLIWDDFLANMELTKKRRSVVS